jgi:hypothetical protein
MVFLIRGEMSKLARKSEGALAVIDVAYVDGDKVRMATI